MPEMVIELALRRQAAPKCPPDLQGSGSLHGLPLPLGDDADEVVPDHNLEHT